MRQAAVGGTRLVHLAEGALSGYAGAAKPHYAGWHIDWAPVAEELAALNKARPWRSTARTGDIYAARRVTDARSIDRTCL
jgi:hypothetical protein